MGAEGVRGAGVLTASERLREVSNQMDGEGNQLHSQFLEVEGVRGVATQNHSR